MHVQIICLQSFRQCLAAKLLAFALPAAVGCKAMAQQQPVTDSLEKKLTAATADSQRVQLLNALCVEYRNTQPAKARSYAEQAWWLALKAEYRKGYADAMRQLGIIDYFQGIYPAALDHYLKAQAVYEEQKDSVNIANCENNIGLIFSGQGNRAEAMRHFKAAQAIYTRRQDQMGVAAALNNIGAVYKAEQRYAEALECFNQSLALKQALNDQIGMANSLNNIGEVYEQQADYPQALRFYLKSLALKRRGNDTRGQVFTLVNLASIYIKQAALPLALNYATRACSTAQAIGAQQELKDAYKIRSEVYSAMGNYAQAYQDQSRYLQIKEKLAGEENDGKLLSLQSNFELNSKQHQIENLTKNQQIQDLELHRQRLWLWGLAVVLLLGFGLAYVWWRAYRQKQRANELLEQRNAAINKQKEELAKQRDEIERKNVQLVNAMEELRTTQEQLIASEKMAALGHLVSNVAHEINTPLGAIRATSKTLDAMLPDITGALPAFLQSLQPAEAELFRILTSQNDLLPLLDMSSRTERQLRRDLQIKLDGANVPGGEELAKALLQCGIADPAQVLPLLVAPRHIEIVQQAARFNQVRLGFANIQASIEKTSKVVYALKMLGTAGGDAQIVTVDLQQTLEACLKAYAGYLRSGIEVQTNYEQGIKVLADVDELNQVWTNLLLNAVQAMGNKGRLSITNRHENGSAMITFGNNGPAIEPEVLPRIFEPFFTTKGGGQGSGLGLYLCRQIVTRYGGAIQAASAPGDTRFLVTLPANNR